MDAGPTEPIACTHCNVYGPPISIPRLGLQYYHILGQGSYLRCRNEEWEKNSSSFRVELKLKGKALVVYSYPNHILEEILTVLEGYGKQVEKVYIELIPQLKPTESHAT